MTKILGVGCLALVCGCGAPTFPKELFTIEGSSADYPVMLSRTRSDRGGRLIEAQSGTHRYASQSTYGNVTVTHESRSESELPASVKLAAQVQRKDTWVQVERAVLTATDYSAIGVASADRNLSISATVHR